MRPSATADDPTAATLDPVTVLLVDDDEPWARTTARLLAESREPLEVETAHSLAAGRERFAALDPDCVVCDYQLGDGTGLAMLETVRDAEPDRPFVLVTGRGSESVASEAIGHGVTDYIRKDREDDAADLLASRVANAVSTYRTERALERERRSKNAMLDILTATTARSNLVRQFCTQLVESRDYDCAWIGTTTSTGDLGVRASAGRDDVVGEPGVPEPAAEHDDRPPWHEAMDRGEPVLDDTLGDGASSGGPSWRRALAASGVEAVAALPVGHEGVRFGVLVVHATGPTAVDEREGLFLAEYAETVGYALRTAELRRSLLAERPVSVDVEVSDPAVPLVALADALPGDGRVEVLSALDRGDGTTLLLTNLEDCAASDVADAAATVDALDVVSVDADDEPLRCEFVVDGPTPEAVLAAHGARFDRTVVDRGTATVSVRVPDDGVVGTLAAALGEHYEGAAVSTIWTERDDGRQAVPADPLDPLTDRQREVITYAFHHGYFEQPRSTSGVDLAETFDISRATLTGHLRSAERKLLAQLLDR